MTTITAPDIDLAGIDLADPAHFVDGPPHDLFARMRREAPVRWNVSRDVRVPSFWSVTRAADIELISKNPGTFSSHQGGIWFREDAVGPLDLLRNLVIFKDPPEHTRFRKLLQTAFTPRTVAKLEDAVRSRVAAVLDVACERGEMDVVTDLAIPIPLMVIAELLGAPQEDVGLLAEWTDRLDGAVADPETGEGVQAMFDMAEYLDEMIPKDPSPETLVGALVRAEIDGEKLTSDEILLFFAVLVFAGNDTTRSATSGGALALLDHPEQRSTLGADPSLIPNAVEEIVRWVTPLNYFARTAAVDAVVGEQEIAAGDRLVMWYASGSRDEAVFAGAGTFDALRPVPAHQGFGGGGRHFCLGAGLARLELRVIFEEYTRRVGSPVLTGPPVRATSAWVNGLASLPIRFTPAD